MPGRVSRRSGRTKAQRNMKAHQRTRQEVAFPFHQSDKRSTAFIHTCLSQRPCRLQRLFNLACFSWPFPFFSISTFSLWKIFLFSFALYSSKCVYYTWFLGLRIYVLSVTVVKKATGKKREIWIQKAEKKTSRRVLLLTTEESHARFITWVLLWICGNVKRSSKDGGASLWQKSQSPFLQRCIFTA